MIHGRVPGIEKPVARIVQGTVMVSPDKEEKGFAPLDEVFEAGGTTFDTAHRYGNGDSERALSVARGRGPRDGVELTTEELAWLEGDEGKSGGGLAFSG